MSSSDQPLSSGDAAAEADDEGANNSGKKKSSESCKSKEAKLVNLTTSLMDSQGGTDGSLFTSN